MLEISLTDFVDFVVKAGTPKLTKVRQIKERGKYGPATDFWRMMREAIIDFHRRGGPDKQHFDRILTNLVDRKKRNRYPDAIKGYKKFLGRKQIQWFEPAKTLWFKEGLNVKINPELGLQISGERNVIKLYFKDEKLEKRKVDVVLALMEDALRKKIGASDKIAILDVSSNIFFPSEGVKDNILPLLIGEAASFVAIWNQLKDKKPL
jgi:hypothetical protein